MSRDLVPPSNGWQPHPAHQPADRRVRRRIFIFIIVVVVGAGLAAAGLTPETVLFTLLGLGLAGATISRWVIDDAPLPDMSLMQSRLW